MNAEERKKFNAEQLEMVKRQPCCVCDTTPAGKALRIIPLSDDAVELATTPEGEIRELATGICEKCEKIPGLVPLIMCAMYYQEFGEH